MTKVRIGVVGTGRIANEMCTVFKHARRGELAAVASADKARAHTFATRHKISAVYEGVSQLLQDPAIEAIYVANATKLHAQTTILALQAGKHVLCEKPFAMSYSAGQAVLQAAETANKIFLEMYWPHSLPTYRHAYELVDRKEIGAPKFFSDSFGYFVSRETAPRLLNKEDGGAILDRLGYHFSFALRVM